MDLLRYLSKAINFTYSLALSPDGQFGNYIIRNFSQPGAKKEWTGLIGNYKIIDLLTDLPSTRIELLLDLCLNNVNITYRLGNLLI